MIAARRNGQSGDSNWSSGQLWFWTATQGATVSTSSPDRGLPDGYPAMVINEYRRVMIGTNTATTAGQPNINQALQVATGYSNDGIVIHGNGSNDGMTGGGFRKIGFRYDESDESFESEIRFVVTDAGAHGGQLEFWTDNSSGTKTRAMTINKSQNVGIGTDSPDKRLTIGGVNATEGVNLYTKIGTTLYKLWEAEQYFSDEGYQGMYYSNVKKIQFRANGDSYFAGGDVGIGMTSPSYRLDINSSDAGLRIVGSTRSQILLSNSTSGWQIESPTSTGNVPAGALGIIESGVGSRLTILTGGNVGIGDTTPSYKLDVAGTIRATGDVIAYSDVRVKENIKTINNSLEKVSKLRGVEFNKIGEDKKSIGVIAQEIEKVIPEVVREDEKGMKSVAYGNISGLLIEAIKELKAEIEELKKHKCNCNK